MTEDLSEKRAEQLASGSNHCFVCGPANPIGLGVTFVMDADVCRGEFTPGPEHMGYDQVTHGGIVFSLLDDVMANWVWLQGDRCFTAKADIRYRAELAVGCRLVLLLSPAAACVRAPPQDAGLHRADSRGGEDAL